MAYCVAPPNAVSATPNAAELALLLLTTDYRVRRALAGELLVLLRNHRLIASDSAGVEARLDLAPSRGDG